MVASFASVCLHFQDVAKADCSKSEIIDLNFFYNERYAICYPSHGSMFITDVDFKKRPPIFELNPFQFDLNTNKMSFKKTLNREEVVVTLFSLLAFTDLQV